MFLLNKMKSVGIEIGTSKSCMGLLELDKIKIIKNLFGEEIEPSVVSIMNDKILAGENVYLSNNSKFNNTIDEIKRLISYNYIYDNKFFEEYKKYLSYNVERGNDNLLSINIDGKIFSIEEIFSFLIKQLVENGKNDNIFVKKFVFVVPSCFGIQEKALIRKSAKLANIDESKLEMINETSAAALAYELMVNKDKYNIKYDYDVFQRDYENLTCGNLTSGPVLKDKVKKDILVFDLGEGSFNLSIISIIETDDKKINFNVKANLGNPFLGGIDFDNKLVQYCIKEFCELNDIKEDDIYNNKDALKILKFRCKIAKQILNKNEDVIIYIPNFIKSIDFCIEITRDQFERICSDYFNEIENKVLKILKIANVEKRKIKEVLMIGGNSKMPKIYEILKNIIFGQEKVINYIDTNKIVITGAALYANEMHKKNKKFFLNEIITSSFGINVKNNDLDSFIKYGDKMFKLIKKNFSFPYNSKFSFKCKISNDNTLLFNIYEGESNYVKFNKKLGGILLSHLNESLENKEVKLDIIFELDKNYILKVKAEIPEIGFKNEISIGNFDKSKLNNVKLNLETGDYNSELFKNKENLKEYSTSYTNYKNEERNKALINCCKCCQEIYEQYKIKYILENRIVKLYHLTKEMFLYYFERLKIKNKPVNDNNEIVKEIKEKMRSLLKIEGFNEILKNIFKDILDINGNIYYSIILNYIELLVSWNVNILKNDNQSKLYLFKIFYEKSKKILEHYSNKKQANLIDEELLEKFKILQKINHSLEQVVSDSNKILEEYQNLEIIKNDIKNLIQNDNRYNCLNDILIIIDDIKNIKI